MNYDKNSLITHSVFAVILFYLTNRIAHAFSILQLPKGIPDVNAVMNAIGAYIVSHPIMLSFKPIPLILGLVAAGCVMLHFIYKSTENKNFRRGEEHGSARFGTPADIKPFMNPEFSQNIILADGVSKNIRTDGSVKPEFQRTNNCLVLGGTGSGKTRFFIKPNVMQMHSNYIITDPKGTLLREVGQMLLNHGYQVKVLNCTPGEFCNSLGYNPFRYIRNQTDLFKFVNILIENTKAEGDKGGDQFWENCEKILYTALIGYLFDTNNLLDKDPRDPTSGRVIRDDFPDEEVNFGKMLELLGWAEAKEENEEFASELDIHFEALRTLKPDSFAVKQYDKFKSAAGKTLKSIIISCHARLVNLADPEVLALLSKDEIHMEDLSDTKTAFFVMLSDNDTTYKFLPAIFFNQVFDVLLGQADSVYKGALPIHMRMMLDEFANLGKLSEIEKKIAVVRSRNISLSIVVQSLGQINALYDKHDATIIDNCDIKLCLGTTDADTNEKLAKMIGHTTVNHTGITQSKGGQGGGNRSEADQINQRFLIEPDEIARMKSTQCLTLIRGLNVFKANKYPLEQHPNIKETTDGGAEKYMYEEHIDDMRATIEAYQEEKRRKKKLAE